jgi:putative membrane protein
MNRWINMCLGLGAAVCLYTAPAAAQTYAPDTTTDVVTPTANSTIIATAPATTLTIDQVTLMAPNMLFDEHFLQELVHANRTEIALSGLALTNSNNPQIIDFARHMIAAHMALGMQVEDLIGSNDIFIQDGLRYHQELTFHDLSTMHGDRFDHAYMRHMVSSHEHVAALLRNEIHRNSDPTCVALANQALPEVENHLAMAQNLNVAINGGNNYYGHHHHHVVTQTEATQP